MTPTQLKNAMIRKNALLVDTQPERAMKEILDDWNGLVGLYWFDQHTNVTDPIDHKGYRFQLDFCIPYRNSTAWVISVNGDYHDTPRIRKKDEWKSRLMLGQYVEGTSLIIDKVINFDAGLLKLKKHRPLAIAALKKALESPDRIVFVDA